MTARPDVPAGGLLHPVPIVALGVLLFNDHYWKGVGPPAVTGILSDVAILVLGPLVLQAGVEWLEALGGSWRARRGVLVASAALLAGIMAAINTWAPAGEAYRVGLGLLQWPFRAAWALAWDGVWQGPERVALVQDPWDLLSLPAALVAVAVGWRRHGAIDAARA